MTRRTSPPASRYSHSLPLPTTFKSLLKSSHSAQWSITGRDGKTEDLKLWAGGTGSRQDGESESRRQTGSQAAVRSEGSMGDGLLGEGAVSTSSGMSGMSGGKGDASRMSTRMGSGASSKAEGAEGAWASWSEGRGGSG
jgi:hypothetical protein